MEDKLIFCHCSDEYFLRCLTSWNYGLKIPKETLFFPQISLKKRHNFSCFCFFLDFLKQVRDLLQQLEPSSPNHLYATSCACWAAEDAEEAAEALGMALAAWLGRHGVLQAGAVHMVATGWLLKICLFYLSFLERSAFNTFGHAEFFFFSDAGTGEWSEDLVSAWASCQPVLFEKTADRNESPPTVRTLASAPQIYLTVFLFNLLANEMLVTWSMNLGPSEG